MKSALFEMTEAKCVCAHVNCRKELNGEEKILACDIKLTWKTTNDVLAMFHPTLKSSFYDPLNTPQEQIRGTAKDHRPLLRFPKLTALAWEQQLADVELSIGVPGKKEVELEACKADKFRLELLDGGNVIVTLRIQCHPTEGEAGRLAAMIQSEVVVTLQGKEVEAPKEQPKLPAPAGGDKKDDKKDEKNAGGPAIH